MNNFWQRLPKPFFVQAPMEDVTDTVFRQMLAKYGPPDVYFTEFTNMDGLMSQGADEVARRLVFTENERPIVAQIWGKDPETYYEGAKKVAAMGFDGIDINMGCPVREVVKRGLCGGMIGNYDLTDKIIRAVQAAAPQLPLSIKTRIGLNTICTEDWVGFLLKYNIQALAIHGRTVKEMSKVPAHWDEIAKAVQIRNNRLQNEKGAVPTLIIGNGDVMTRQEGLARVAETGVDGIMIGRGMLHDISVFQPNSETKLPSHIEPSIAERLTRLHQHLTLYQSTWGNGKNLHQARKYMKMYIRDFEGSSEMREALMNMVTYAEVFAALDSAIDSSQKPTS